jgi:hypothetical protein
MISLSMQQIQVEPSGFNSARSLFLRPLVMVYRRLYGGHRNWAFSLIMKFETGSGAGKLRKYLPRSDLLVFKSKLLRLLVQVNSAPNADRPEDLTRMLLCGAAVVRFANNSCFSPCISGIVALHRAIHCIRSRIAERYDGLL